jgi:hypothetical protein
MRSCFLAGALAVYQLACSASVVSAGEASRILSPKEKRAYHACLYGSFIRDYCRYHAWGWSEAAFRECVIANGAGRIPIGLPYWRWEAYSICRALAQRGL